MQYGQRTNCQTLKKTHKACGTWENTHGVTFATKKYSVVVRPTMAYGGPIWFDAEDTKEGRNNLIYPLQVVQNRWLRAIAEAYRSKNIAELEHGTSIEPLNLHLQRMS